MYTNYAKDQLLEGSRLIANLLHSAGSEKLTVFQRKYYITQSGHVSRRKLVHSLVHECKGELRIYENLNELIIYLANCTVESPEVSVKEEVSLPLLCLVVLSLGMIEVCASFLHSVYWNSSLHSRDISARK